MLCCLFVCFFERLFKISYVIVNPLPEANPVATLIACELNTDGIYAFDLEVQTDLIRGAQSASEFLVTYYETSLDATQGINPLTSPYMNTSNPQTLYVNVLNTITRCQNTTIEFKSQAMLVILTLILGLRIVSYFTLFPGSVGITRVVKISLRFSLTGLSFLILIF